MTSTFDHMDFAAAESAALNVTAWDRWIAKAETLIGHSLDGDGAADGYSLDEAVERFNAGAAPAAYVTMVATRDRYRAPAVA
jgi:hypothetical protein